jgi:hypothetical protein
VEVATTATLLYILKESMFTVSTMHNSKEATQGTAVIVQPLEIQYEADSQSRSYKTYVEISSDPGMDHGKEESSYINSAIRSSHGDGLQIISEEHHGTAVGEAIGKFSSNSINSRLTLGGTKDDINDLSFKSNVNTNYVLRTVPRTDVAGQSIANNFQSYDMPEYNSVYGDQEYKIPEYKSVYERTS